MFRGAISLISFLALAAVQPANAQTQPAPSKPPMSGGSLRESQQFIARAPSEYDYKFARDWAGEGQSYRTALRLASCVARLNKGVAHSAALTDAATQQGVRELQRMSGRNRGCVPAALMMSPIVLRAAFFETAMRHGPVPTANLGLFRNQDRELAISWCQTMEAPVAAKDVFATQPESAEEEMAIANLLSSTPECGTVVIEKGGATVWRLALLEAAARGSM